MDSRNRNETEENYFKILCDFFFLDISGCLECAIPKEGNIQWKIVQTCPTSFFSFFFLQQCNISSKTKRSTKT